jgi:hypothetical protein
LWKKIVNYEIFSDIRPGSLISQKPNDPSETFEVGLKTDGYINVSHAVGDPKLTIYSVAELLKGEWWLME